MAPSRRPQPELGQAIRELRVKRGLTQEAVAHEAGVTASTYGLIERGHSNPTWATLKDISAALGVSMIEVAKGAAKFEEGS
jgi:transcriptional regulator with XRE-family HTH domain